MAQWMEDTKDKIKFLKQEGYFDNWQIKKTKYITFYIYPDLDVLPEWIKNREDIYIKNFKLFEIKDAPSVNFYVYPSIDAVKKLGIIPAVSFLKQKEIHGHLKQSPGHELTHVLLGSLNPSENISPNGLWSEGMCVYFDGTETDRKKHANSMNYPEEVINTPWNLWKINFPGNLYPLAGSVIQYCVEKYGIKLLLFFIKEMRSNGENEEKLCKKHFGILYGQLQNNWKNWLKI